MNRDSFKFFLYRLNKEYRTDLFSNNTEVKTDDLWIQEFLSNICIEKFDYENKTVKAVYTWSVRNYQNLEEGFSSIVLARSQMQKKSTIVTKDSLTEGNSIALPPPADTIILLILWERHIVIVENRSGMTTGETWLRNFHEIVDNAKLHINIPVIPRLEPIPVTGTILHHFSNLDKIFRFRVRLKLPNPELNRWAEKVYNEMVDGSLTEYLQEFYSPNGINVTETSKAHSSAAMAELGYKDGGVHIEGEKNGSPINIDEGKTAIRGKIDQMRSFIRGLEVNTHGVYAQKALCEIHKEVDRLFPVEK
jgi:hypothetical protein